jgi:hypothetical protein
MLLRQRAKHAANPALTALLTSRIIGHWMFRVEHDEHTCHRPREVEVLGSRGRSYQSGGDEPDQWS